MARIADEVIERLKNEVSLVRLMESQGFELKKHGKDYVCRCPFCYLLFYHHTFCRIIHHRMC